MISELGRTAIVDLRADNDREELRLCHFCKIHPHESRESCAASLDHPEICDVMDYPAAISVEKHDLFLGDQAWLLHELKIGGLGKNDQLKKEKAEHHTVARPFKTNFQLI